MDANSILPLKRKLQNALAKRSYLMDDLSADFVSKSKKGFDNGNFSGRFKLQMQS